jgi:hypothetical protein
MRQCVKKPRDRTRRRKAHDEDDALFDEREVEIGAPQDKEAASEK